MERTGEYHMKKTLLSAIILGLSFNSYAGTGELNANNVCHPVLVAQAANLIMIRMANGTDADEIRHHVYSIATNGGKDSSKYIDFFTDELSYLVDSAFKIKGFNKREFDKFNLAFQLAAIAHCDKALKESGLK